MIAAGRDYVNWGWGSAPRPPILGETKNAPSFTPQDWGAGGAERLQLCPTHTRIGPAWRLAQL